MQANRKASGSESLRKPLKAELRVYYGPSQERVLYGFSVDMSDGGLFLQTDNAFSVDEQVMLSFTLPDVKKVVNCAAKIAWINSKKEPKKTGLPTGVGLQFLDLSSEYLLSIQSLLQHGGFESVSDPEK